MIFLIYCIKLLCSLKNEDNSLDKTESMDDGNECIEIINIREEENNDESDAIKEIFYRAEEIIKQYSELHIECSSEDIEEYLNEKEMFKRLNAYKKLLNSQHLDKLSIFHEDSYFLNGGSLRTVINFCLKKENLNSRIIVFIHEYFHRYDEYSNLVDLSLYYIKNGFMLSIYSYLNKFLQAFRHSMLREIEILLFIDGEKIFERYEKFRKFCIEYELQNNEFSTDLNSLIEWNFIFNRDLANNIGKILAFEYTVLELTTRTKKLEAFIKLIKIPSFMLLSFPYNLQKHEVSFKLTILIIEIEIRSELIKKIKNRFKQKKIKKNEFIDTKLYENSLENLILSYNYLVNKYFKN